jgi:hypothetical protein
MIQTLVGWHASTYNAYSVPIPDAVLPAVRSFLKQCGYRLTVRSVMAPRRAARGGKLALQITMENLGIAPPYRNYVLSVRLRGGGRDIVLDTKATPREWLPGSHTLTESLELPPDIGKGGYELAVGLLHPHYRKPYVKLAMAGRDPSGWYPVGRVDVA